MLDLFCGRGGWTKGFMAEGWECVGVDLNPQPNYPAEFVLGDVLGLDSGFLCQFDFAVASSPCEQFSVHCMKHFHRNPPFPELGIKLFEHTRNILEQSGLPYVMENVRCAEKFVGRSVNHCGPFYLWGNAVPAAMPKDVYSLTKTKWTMNHKLGRNKPGNQCPEFFINKRERAAKLAMIPEALSRYVAQCATRLVAVEADRLR